MHFVWINKDIDVPKWMTAPPKNTPAAKTAWNYWHKIWEAQPGWASKEKIKAIYRLADRYKQLGFEVEVDHEVPLKHPLVCGLHWEGNLVIRTKRDNQDKSNLYWPDMPESDQLELHFG